MRKKEPDYKKVYAKFFDLDRWDFIPCTLCGMEAVDLHHIKFKSRGGKNTIDNLIALCRGHHDRAHGVGNNPKISEEFLRTQQANFIKEHLNNA